MPLLKSVRFDYIAGVAGGDAIPCLGRGWITNVFFCNKPWQPPAGRPAASQCCLIWAVAICKKKLYSP